jgi:hypothetical protein
MNRAFPGHWRARRGMDSLWHLNLIHLLDFYFAFMFFAGTYRRFQQYQTMGRLAWSMPGRWPTLLRLIHQHRTLLLTWKTAAPALLALAVLLVQMTASRLVWPDAGHPPYGLELHHLLEHWPALLAVAPLGIAMLTMDLWGLIVVGAMDRPQMEKYFDQAEYWLRSPTAYVVQYATLGFINPRQMVAVEVRKALEAASGLINYTLWWIVSQTGLRFGFGLSLWLTWALAVL